MTFTFSGGNTVEGSFSVTMDDREAYDRLLGLAACALAYLTVTQTIKAYPRLRRPQGTRGLLRQVRDVIVWDFRGLVGLPRAADRTMTMEIPAANFSVERLP